MTNDVRSHVTFSLKNKLIRLLWKVIENTLFSWSPRPFHRWRRFLLILFGAKISKSAHVYPSVKIWLPSNLIMEQFSCAGDSVDIYNIEVVHIKSYATVSKRSWICTASHNIDNPRHELITGSITIGHYVWVAGEAFVGPGVTLHDGCVVGTRATMLTDGKPWYVFGGVPAKAIRKRGFEKTPNE